VREVLFSDPHPSLALGVVLALSLEYLYREHLDRPVILFLEALVLAPALLNAWRQQDRLRLPVILALTLALQLGYTLLHIGLGLHADFDPRNVYSPQGQSLLDGDYPRSEYPLGAVLLFAFEALLGGGDAERPNALLMIPFQLVLVASLWHVSRRYGPWLASAVALWPVSLYFWEYRFDLVPAALLALRLVLALRERWGWCGLALALGAFVKWTPWLALLALGLWLLVNRRWPALERLLAGSLGVVLLHVPFAIWAGADLAAAYTTQGRRPITAESIWFPLLHALGIVDAPESVWLPAGAPRWANATATIAQALVLAAILFGAARARQRETAVALAALVPVAFLLTNRIFSPQFVIVMTAGWAVAIALVARSRREQLALGGAILAASGLNVLVYPLRLGWEPSSVAFFAAGLGVTAWALGRALVSERRPSVVSPLHT
jgi:hypothetical protein